MQVVRFLIVVYLLNNIYMLSHKHLKSATAWSCARSEPQLLYTFDTRYIIATVQ